MLAKFNNKLSINTVNKWDKLLQQWSKFLNVTRVIKIDDFQNGDFVNILKSPILFDWFYLSCSNLIRLSEKDRVEILELIGKDKRLFILSNDGQCNNIIEKEVKQLNLTNVFTDKIYSEPPHAKNWNGLEQNILVEIEGRDDYTLTPYNLKDLLVHLNIEENSYNLSYVGSKNVTTLTPNSFKEKAFVSNIINQESLQLSKLLDNHLNYPLILNVYLPFFNLYNGLADDLLNYKIQIKNIVEV